MALPEAARRPHHADPVGRAPNRRCAFAACRPPAFRIAGRPPHHRAMNSGCNARMSPVGYARSVDSAAQGHHLNASTKRTSPPSTWTTSPVSRSVNWATSPNPFDTDVSLRSMPPFGCAGAPGGVRPLLRPENSRRSKRTSVAPSDGQATGASSTSLQRPSSADQADHEAVARDPSVASAAITSRQKSICSWSTGRRLRGRARCAKEQPM